MSKRRTPVAGFSWGLLFSRPLRRVVHAAGYSVTSGWLGVRRRDVAVWGRIARSRWVMEKHPDVITFEDSFLRSVLPGLGILPIGLSIDKRGVYFDSSCASDLEVLLQASDFDAPLLQRAKNGRALLQHYGLSKYNAVPRGHGDIPEAGYVLVVDQVAGDASISGAGACSDTFRDMLEAAKSENPDCRILIRTHPATAGGAKAGHFSQADMDARVKISDNPLNPWDVLEGATSVYCVSSQMGFDAILAGHTPHLFGVPFYAGWGLSHDRPPAPRRTRTLTVDQLFAGAMLLYPFWYNHARQAACGFEEAAEQLLAQARHHWETRQPSVALGMRLWKRRVVSGFLGPTVFSDDPVKALDRSRRSGRNLVVWAGKESENLAAQCADNNVDLLRMEDGFLRSKGLGAELVPAVSLVLDDLGIYYDPSRPSRLEVLIEQAAALPEFARIRAEKLRMQIVEGGVSKYNLVVGPSPKIPADRTVILVPGQVEDDASILKGAGEIVCNLELLKAARAENPSAFIIYKPHPDVMAGLRKGAVSDEELQKHCDLVSSDATLDICDEVWTITSLMGFEGLLRGKVVTCLGMPFYAGWGLTNDLGPKCPRRTKTVSLDGLVHAALIDYPRYMDPKSGLPTTPELAVERLASGQIRHGFSLRILSKLQGAFASYASIWR